MTHNATITNDARAVAVNITTDAERKENHMKPVRNPHDHNRLILAIDEKQRVVEQVDKGWVTRVEFKDDGTATVTHYKKTAA
jgi:hypothetical protein